MASILFFLFVTQSIVARVNTILETYRKGMYICSMYVFIESALCGIANCYVRSNWAQRRDSEILGPMSQPRGNIDTASRTPDHTCALNMRFLNQL